MPENEIYKFLKENNLTQKNEQDFLTEYSAPEKAKELHSFMATNKLTDKSDTEFYDTYFKKKVPTDLSGTGALVSAPQRKPSKLEHLLSQNKSFVYTPGSEDDLVSEKFLEDQTELVLKERQKNAFNSLVSIPEKKLQPGEPLSVNELNQNLQKAVSDSHKLSKKLELTESESASFANPLVRLTGKPTSPVPSDLTGVNFWANEYLATNALRTDELTGKQVKKGFEQYPYSRADGVMFEKQTLAPVVLKKVMDDYMNFIQKTQPEKYKSLSLLDRGEITPAEAQEIEARGGKLAEYITPYIDKSRALKSISEGKAIPVNRMENIDRYKLLMEALNHQSIILNQDYADMKKEGVTDADEKYKQGRKALEDLSKDILKSFPDIIGEIEQANAAVAKVQKKQAAADQFYDNYLRRGGFLADPDMGLRMYMAQPVASSLQNFAGGWLTLPRELGIEGESPFLAEMVKLGESVASDENVPMLSTEMQESLVPQIVKGVSDMSLLLLGTKGLGSVKAAGYKPSMFANSFAITHDNYYQEAKNAGLTDREASDHAARSAALTSALEFVSPNTALINGFKTGITPSVIKGLSEGLTPQQAFTAGTKDFFKQIGAENAQELTQLFGDKLSNYYTNNVLGKSALDTEVSAKEVLNTLMVTTAVTGLVSAPMVRNKSTLQRDLMYTAAANPELAANAIENAIETKQINKQQAQDLKKKLTDFKTVIDGLPTNIPQGLKPKMADLIYQKKLLAEQKTESYVDPVFKNVKEAEQLQAEEEINNEINQTLNDTQKQVGLPGSVGVGETIIETGNVEETGSEKIESDRILQKEEPSVDSPKPDEELEAYVQRMLEEHKVEDEVAGPEETAFAEKFYTKKWMDKFGQAKPIAEQPVLTEQQIEETPYGDQETADAFEGRVQDEVNESEAVIEAIEREAEDVGSSQDRARAAELYGRVTDVIGQKIADLRTRKGYSVENKEGKLTVLNTEGQPVKSDKVRQAVLRNYKNTLKVLNDSGTLRVVDETGAEVTKPEFTESLIAKYKATFPFDQGRTSIEVAETGDPVELSENPMELAAIGTPEAAVKFKQLTGIEMEEYLAPKVSDEQNTLRDRFNKSIDEVIKSFDKMTGSFIVPPQVIKAALRVVKTAVNAGFTIEEAVSKGVEAIKKSQWFKAAGNPEDAIKQFTGTVQGAQQRAEGTEPIEKTPNEDRKALSTAKKGRKQISKKIRAKQKGAVSVFANDRNALKEFIKLDPREVSDVNEYNDLVNRIKESLNNPIIRSDGSIKRGGRVISNNEISQYIDKEQKFIKAQREQRAREEYAALLEEGISIDQILSGEMTEAMLKPDTREVKRQAIRGLVEKKLGALSAFVKHKEDGESIYGEWTDNEKKLWDQLSTIDTDISITDLVSLNNVLENIATNESLDGAGKLSQLSESQKIVPQIVKMFDEIEPGKISEGLGAFRNAMYSVPLMVERITLNGKKAAELNRLMGISEIFSSHVAIDKKMEKIAEEVHQLKKGMEDPDSLKNRFTRGIYASLIRNKGGNESDLELEFARKKALVEDQIKKLSEYPDGALQEQSKLIQEIYTEMGAKEAMTPSELKVSPDNKKIVDKFIQEASEFRDDLDEHDRLYNNKGITPENNYTATRYKNIGKVADTGLTEVDSSVFNRDVFTGGSRTTLATVDNWSLPQDKMLDFDFDNVQAAKIREAFYQMESQNARSKFKNLMKNPEVVKALGGMKNRDALMKAITSSVNAQLRIMPHNEAVKLANNITNIFAAKGARIALASISQPVGQVPSVWTNAAFNLGPKRAFEMLGYPSTKVNENLFKYGTILGRKGMRAGYQRELSPEDIEKAKKATYKFLQYLGTPRHMWEQASNALMFPLINSDFRIARRSWMAYYKKFREVDQGVKDFDWQKESENPDPQASAYAEQMVDRSQNVSEYSKQGEGQRRTGGVIDIVKNVALPFNGFAVNQRGRLYNDISKIKANPGNPDAYQSLGGTMAEIVAFNSLKIFAIGWLTTQGGCWLLKMFGMPCGEDKANSQKAVEMGAKSIKDLFTSGLGSIAETGGSWLINQGYKTAYETDKDVLKIYNDPNDLLPWQALGVYGATFDAADEMIRDYHAFFTGETEAIVKGGPKYIEEVGQLSEKEQNILGLLGTLELLKIVGFSDQLLNSAARKAKSQVMRQIQKREGTTYDMTMGIPGEAYKKEDSGGGRSRVKRERKERTRRNRR